MKPTNQYDYDDGDIPPIDLPRDDSKADAEPLLESTKSRKEGLGGE